MFIRIVVVGSLIYMYLCHAWWDEARAEEVALSGEGEENAGDGGADPKLQDIRLDEGEEGEAEAEEEEEEAAEPAAKHGWNEDAVHKDAVPEAGPQGLASETAAAQARF